MKQPDYYDRETLYREVWAEPVKTVAARYGVSDVALAKTCRRLEVPLPGRGYWARVKAGQKPERPPLPSPSPEALWPRRIQPTLPPEPERTPSPSTGARMEQETTAEAAIVVADTLERPHPLVRHARSVLGARKRNWDRECLDISVGRESLDRALRIMDALIRAFRARGLLVEVTPFRLQGSGPYRYPDRKHPESNVTRVQAEGEWVHFGLKEKMIVVYPPAPEPPANLRGEKRDDWIRWHRPSRELVYNGTFVFFLANVDRLNVRKEWKDRAKVKVEDQLNDIVAHVYLAGEALKEKRAADERARLAAIEREKQRREEEERRAEHERRAKVLDDQMVRWEKAAAIRRYVREARTRWIDEEEVGEDAVRVEEWLTWAEEYADGLDPMLRLPGWATGGLVKPKYWWSGA